MVYSVVFWMNQREIISFCINISKSLEYNYFVYHSIEFWTKSGFILYLMHNSKMLAKKRMAVTLKYDVKYLTKFKMYFKLIMKHLFRYE